MDILWPTLISDLNEGIVGLVDLNLHVVINAMGDDKIRI